MRTPKETLQISYFNLNIKTNGIQHHTIQYHEMRRADPCLVLRRGQEFVIDLRLSRKYDATTDDLVLTLTLERKGPVHRISMPLQQSGTNTKDVWTSSIVHVGESSLRIKIMPSSKAIIGKWTLEVESKLNGSQNEKTFKINDSFYLIFNPWCPDDTVYMSAAEKRQEYVMEGHGYLAKRHWEYNQFEEHILDCAFLILYKIAKLEDSDRNDSVMITRVLTWALHSMGNSNGVLQGRWGDDEKLYIGGTAPTLWKNSKDILHQYFHTQKTVKYGQCWVYAAILTTICRTLGIPSRVITNWESAHEVDGTFTIDFYGKISNGHFEKEKQDDLDWNFHAWTETWMTRPDLGKAYDGWQAVDATPQEASKESKNNGMYCCGPASVVAIKKGETKLPFDNTFIFNEVFAPRLHWVKNGDKLTLVQGFEDFYAKAIVTRSIGQNVDEIVTSSYKDEDPKVRRNILMEHLAEVNDPRIKIYLEDLQRRRELVLNIETVEKKLGENFSSIISLKNLCVKPKVVTVSTTVYIMDVLRNTRSVVKRTEPMKIELDISSIEELEVEVTWEDYASKLVDEFQFQIESFVTEVDTDNHFISSKRYTLAKPEMNFETNAAAYANEKYPLTVSFTNPLPVSIEKGTFTIRASCLPRSFDIELEAPVKPGEKAICQFKLIPRREGNLKIGVEFDSGSGLKFTKFATAIVKNRRNRPHYYYT